MLYLSAGSEEQMAFQIGVKYPADFVWQYGYSLCSKVIEMTVSSLLTTATGQDDIVISWACCTR